MYKNKRGQASMEFLMTYGWAILAAIIAIGVLAYFGVFSPGKFVQDSYLINAPFSIKAGTVTGGSPANVTIDLYNGAGEQVLLTNISVSGCVSLGIPAGVSSRVYIGNSNNVLSFNLKNGTFAFPASNQSTFTMECETSIVTGNTFK